MVGANMTKLALYQLTAQIGYFSYPLGGIRKLERLEGTLYY
jgi:hypothetical protein